MKLAGSCIGAILFINGISIEDVLAVEGTKPEAATAQPIHTTQPAPPSADSKSIAAEKPQTKKSAGQIETTLTVEGVQRHFNYVETENGFGLDSERGHIRGYAAAIKQQDQKSGRYWQLRYEQTVGSLVYDGHLIDPLGHIEPYEVRSSAFVEDIQAIYGIPVSRDKKQSIYLGLGWHKWDRWVARAYTETYQWPYIPVGYRYEFLDKEKLHMAVDLSVKFMFNARMTSPSIPYHLGNRAGLRLELPICYTMNKHWGIVLTPWYEYMSIGKSPMVIIGAHTGAYEPASSNRQYGVNIGLQYHF